MYGRSESEYTLIGGETGRESADVIVDKDSSESVLRGLSRRPVSKLRLPEAIAPPLDDVPGRPSTDLPYEGCCDILPNPELAGCDCSEPIVDYSGGEWSGGGMALLLYGHKITLSLM